MTIQIKKCSRADVLTLQKVGRETFYETFKDDNSEENMKNYLATAFSEEKLINELENPNSLFFIASVNNEVAGYLKLNVGEAQTELLGDNTLEVERIYIKRTFQKHGLGKKLMNLAISTAKDLAKVKVWLGVWEKNVNAIAFYEHNGFKKIGKHTFQMGDEAQVDYVMEKTL